MENKLKGMCSGTLLRDPKKWQYKNSYQNKPHQCTTSTSDKKWERLHGSPTNHTNITTKGRDSLAVKGSYQVSLNIVLKKQIVDNEQSGCIQNAHEHNLQKDSHANIHRDKLKNQNTGTRELHPNTGVLLHCAFGCPSDWRKYSMIAAGGRIYLCIGVN